MLTRLSRSGREVVLYVHKKGAFVGLPSALAGFPLRMNAQSLTHSIVYETGYNDFKSLMSRFPVLFERVMFQLYVTLGIISEQYLSAFSDDAEIRLKKLLVRLFSDELLRPGVDKRPNGVMLNLTQDQLAAAIGTSRPMVNKILRRMMANGIISISSHKISFLKPDKLLSYLDLAPANRVV
jgi:CRP-like cAMP-binding protein